MKKLFAILVGCLLVTVASAQTVSKGKILLSPTLTNMSFNGVTVSHEGAKQNFSRFGLQASGGYAIMDDLAVMAGLGLQTGKYDDSGATALDVYVGARYYVIPNVYAGAKLVLGTASIKNDVSSKADDAIKANTLGVELNAGYSFFITDRFAFEPSISYLLGLNTKVQEMNIGLSMFSVNFGFLFVL